MIKYKLNAQVMNEGWMDGSTSVVMAVTSRYIMVANAGDSRAVLMDGDKVSLSVCLPACLPVSCLSVSVCGTLTHGCACKYTGSAAVV